MIIRLLCSVFWLVLVCPGPGAIGAQLMSRGPGIHPTFSVYLSVKMAAAWRWPAGQWRHDFWKLKIPSGKSNFWPGSFPPGPASRFSSLILGSTYVLPPKTAI